MANDDNFALFRENAEDLERYVKWVRTSSLQARYNLWLKSMLKWRREWRIQRDIPKISRK